jgi:hypothetical protein
LKPAPPPGGIGRLHRVCRKQFLFWLAGAKRAETRAKRVATIVRCAAAGITLLRYYDASRKTKQLRVPTLDDSHDAADDVVNGHRRGVDDNRKPRAVSGETARVVSDRSRAAMASATAA